MCFSDLLMNIIMLFSVFYSLSFVGRLMSYWVCIVMSYEYKSKLSKMGGTANPLSTPEWWWSSCCFFLLFFLFCFYFFLFFVFVFDLCYCILWYLFTEGENMQDSNTNISVLFFYVWTVICNKICGIHILLSKVFILIHAYFQLSGGKYVL